MNADLLFVDDNHVISRIAQTIAKMIVSEEIRVESAGYAPEKLTDQLSGVLLGFGAQISEPVAVEQISNKKYDLVINICDSKLNENHIFPGIPAIVTWNVQTPQDINKDAFQPAYNALKILIEDLFNRGFFSALLQQRSYLEDLFDSLHDGIIAHDLNRKIFLFSKGAELLTGVKKEMVLGKDCHDLFAPHFCGNQCIFCDSNVDYSKMPKSSFPSIFNAPDGTRKEFDVTRVPFKNENGLIIGAIATIHDSTRVHELESKLLEAESFSGIIGQDYKMLEIFSLIKDLSQSDFPVVITGESGTGKELVAAALHNESRRRDRLFVPVNCGALPEGTLESELFGHVKGAFTGAIRDKKGRFELANNGTLFLDEIGELSLRMQVKLLRVLQEGVFEPVGSEVAKKVDVRVLCATNRNLKEMIAAGTFREDLYYRLAVVPMEIPPLRERRNDIVLLASHFLKKNVSKLGRGTISFSDDALSFLMNYQWPGNVRQLQNAIQFALVKCRGDVILPEHLPPEIISTTFVPFTDHHVSGKAGRKPKLTISMVEQALVKAGGNKAKAARILGVGRATLYNFMNSNKNVLEVS